MKKTKECFGFADKNVCKICGCKDGSCGCDMKLEKIKAKEKLT